MIIALIQSFHLLWLSVLEFFPSTEFFVYPYLKSLSWIPYSQIVDHHFPGLLLGPITFANLGFVTPESFKSLVLLVVLLQSVLIYKITKSKFTVLLYAIWQPFFGGNILWYDLFQSLFTLLGYFFLKRERFTLMGLSLGAGLIWKQSLFPLVLIIGLQLLLKRNFKKITGFVLGVCIPLVLLTIYVNHWKIWQDFWFWNVTFNITTYRELASTLITKTELLKISVPAITMIALGEFALLGWGILSIIGGLSRFGFEHFQPLIPFAAMAVGNRLKTRNLKLKTILVVINLVWVISWEIRSGNFGKIRYFDDDTYRLANLITKKTTPGDEVFLMGVQPIVYVLSKTTPPGHYFSYQLPWIMKVNEDRLLESWMRGNTKIAVRNLADSKNVSLKLVQYLESNYLSKDKIGNYIVYERRP
jgi:hypothetical protein